ncbi:hypothetical protein [Peredibacter starrii]|uniref:Lipoprotein n=1 Tax=Peredibacter starrii TaxID=28202 RepID=A0AAX4HS93_9BACT|nr:hypothetical protein [Peredibacter starrii]WPU66097.1 hypothetical protein SOO65_04995 [Peredibacter starrii]
MKIIYFLIAASILSSCAPSRPENPSNDYVLIEFASKLEEEKENQSK